MVDTSDGPRGIQTGYNICNSTTEGPQAMCQTATVNNLDGKDRALLGVCSRGLYFSYSIRFLYLGSPKAKLDYCRHGRGACSVVYQAWPWNTHYTLGCSHWRAVHADSRLPPSHGSHQSELDKYSAGWYWWRWVLSVMQFCDEISLIIRWILLPTEEDPHGADGRGNPLGSLIFSNGFPSNNGNNGTFQQVIEWHKYVLY